MDRELQWRPDLTCDRCGCRGATDFMGDHFCDDCLVTDDDGFVSVKDGLPDPSVSGDLQDTSGH